MKAREKVGGEERDKREVGKSKGRKKPQKVKNTMQVYSLVFFRCSLRTKLLDCQIV